MQKSTAMVHLLCLTSKVHQDRVVDALQTSIETVSVLEANCWLERRIGDPQSIIVLILPEQGGAIQKIAEAILATPGSLYLGVTVQPYSDEYGCILSLCGDFCCGDANQDELIFRLKRLGAKIKPVSATNKFNVEESVWKDMNLIGQSSLFDSVLLFIKQASECSAPVLIEGETGCGKEVTARAIHYLGCRKDFPFIPMNCGAVPDQLIENELFGHEKGAYTDARQRQSGLTEQADGGTLFLDEIEVLSPKGQVALLRFIEDNLVRPLGADKSRRVNVRVIAASNVKLSDLVAQGKFRQDLLFRLNLLYLNLPPLRKRKKDIQYLAEHFMQKYRHQYRQPNKWFHSETIEWMNNYDWPGNVRELENFVHRSFLLSNEHEVFQIGVSQEHDELFSRRKHFDRRQIFKFDASFNDAKTQTLNTFEQRYLTWLIANTNGNVTKAAEIAQKERRALGKLLKKHDISPVKYRQ